MQISHRAAAAGAAVVTGLATLGAAGATPAPSSASRASDGVQVGGSIHWGKCADPVLQQAHASCALLAVPLDYRNPGGPKIKIAVNRIRHTSKNYQGVLVTAEGDFNPFFIGALKAEHLGAAAADYDWIGFFPRGFAPSVPAITCDPGYFSPDRRSYTPQPGPVLRYWKARSADYAADCATHSAAQTALLGHMTTADSARDMDSIRQALGRAQITYYGISATTYLGQVYATLFPGHVRRLVFDSSIDPRKSPYQDMLATDIPMNRNLKIWFGWLAKYHKVYRLGRSERAVEHRWYAEKARLAGHPALGQVGPDEWADIFALAGIFQASWVDFGLNLSQAFADWAHTHNTTAGKNLVGLYRAVDGPGNDNQFAAGNAVVCTDPRWPQSWARWSQDAQRLNRAAPFYTWANVWLNAPCRYWKAPARTPVTVNGSQITSALLTDETLDALTPFSGSVEVRRLFPYSALIAVPGGTSHANSLSGNLCVDRTIARYLENGTLPPRKPHARWDKTCPPLPRPVPTASGPVKRPANRFTPR
jgi:pimeloyl-ACP methyl ester carboxylesterase